MNLRNHWEKFNILIQATTDISCSDFYIYSLFLSLPSYMLSSKQQKIDHVSPQLKQNVQWFCIFLEAKSNISIILHHTTHDFNLLPFWSHLFTSLFCSFLSSKILFLKLLKHTVMNWIMSPPKFLCGRLS